MNTDFFTPELIQAVSDWQRGGDHRQKVKRGQRLKECAAALPIQFRTSNQACYRQEAHKKDRIWQLLIDKCLPETIASWTTSVTVAKHFNHVGAAAFAGRTAQHTLRSASHHRIGHWAHLFGTTAQRVPILPVGPGPLAEALRGGEQLCIVNAIDDAVVHAHPAVDDHGLHIVADAAFDQAVNGVAHGPMTNAALIDKDDVGLGARRKAAEIAATQRLRTREGGGIEYLASARGT
jgi:hypothetical protein